MRENTGKASVGTGGLAASTAMPKRLSVIQQKRIRMFEEIQRQRSEELQAIGGDPIKITLPDGSVRSGSKWRTSPLDVAEDISKHLATSALVAKVDGEPWDMARPLQGDCRLKILTSDDEEGRETLRHSSVHILGQALENVYNCKLCIGPCTTLSESFYYDALYGDKTLEEEDLRTIRLQAERAVQEKQPFERIEVTRKEALEIFSENPFKAELLESYRRTKPLPCIGVDLLLIFAEGHMCPIHQW